MHLKQSISIQEAKTAFHTSSERIARAASCIEPYFFTNAGKTQNGSSYTDMEYAP